MKRTDEQIQKDVMAELKWEPVLHATEIGVAVKNGIVTLSGVVDSYSKKVSAEKAAKRVAGVEAVVQDIDVKLSSFGERTDTDIAEAVVKAFKWNSLVPEEKIKTKVEDGWVTLEGEVEWEFQKTAAYKAVKDLLGVKGVFNNIKLISKLKPTEIKEKIKVAFERSAILDAENVNIETSGNKVILKGSVRSWTEKIDAENAAYAAPGVTEVENQLLVDSEIAVY